MTDLEKLGARLATDVEPPVDLWPGIAQAIEAETAALDRRVRQLPLDREPAADMWPAIRASLGERHGAPGAAPRRGLAPGAAPRSAFARWRTAGAWAVAAALAAALVAGVWIGRLSTGADRPGERIGPQSVVEESAGRAGVGQARVGEDRAGQDPAAPSGAGGTADPRLAMPYRLAVGHHFQQAETLLMLFETTGEADGELARLARELAATSRLLMDSRAGEDAEVRAMLLDLELLLAQITQLVDGDDAVEQQIVRDGVEDSGVLGRLRQLVPEESKSGI